MDVQITDLRGKIISIPVEGSLGLLALGYKGLMAWRKVRAKALNTHRDEA